MEKPPLVVSACLLGRQCRYDGSSVPFPQAAMLEERYTLIPVCPEVLGGLQTPRSPSELVEGRVMSREGDDCTEAFLRGAQRALEIAKESGCKRALLMDRSPSCGYGVVYDGSFRGILNSRQRHLRFALGVKRVYDQQLISPWGLVRLREAQISSRV